MLQSPPETSQLVILAVANDRRTISPMLTRRRFLQNSAAAFLFTPNASAFPAADSGIDSRIEVLLDEPLGTISPDIYGHFAEHLGGVIYDGIWVGRNSKVSNVDGIRKQFVDDMKRIGAPNLRWPGGCFADGYHWRDGVGAAGRRPRTYNYWESRMPP